MKRSKVRLLLIVLASIAVATTMMAIDEEPKSVLLETPDYSEEALLEILRTESVELGVFEDRVELRWADWILRFLPIVLPLTLNDGSYGTANINGPVSGLALLGVDYPLAGPAGDELPPESLSWRERRFRWRMIGEINRANERDNR